LLISMSTYVMCANVEIAMENDNMGRTDRHYTHGTRITYSYPIKSDMFPDKNVYRRWCVGQYMYTPSEINLETIQVGDRPYGGWAYGATSVSVSDDTEFDFLQIDLGVTGDWSGAGQTQRQIHEWIDSTEPMGWDTQLDEKVGVNVTYIKKYKLNTNYTDFLREYTDLIFKGSATLGNIYANGSLGTSFRLGYNIPDDFGGIRMEPTSRGVNKFGAYGIAEVMGRYVGYNYFLQGDDTEEVYQISMENFVYDLAVGFGGYYGDFDLVYLYNIRSKEFKEQADHNEFGTIAISWSY